MGVELESFKYGGLCVESTVVPVKRSEIVRKGSIKRRLFGDKYEKLSNSVLPCLLNTGKLKFKSEVRLNERLIITQARAE